MVQPPFGAWLARKSWAVGVRYCKAVMWVLPLAALVMDVPLGLDTSPAAAAKLPWVVGWQIAVALACLAVVLTDRLLPAAAGREPPLYIFCGVFMVLVTWVGVAGAYMGGTGLAIYAAGSTFIAAVICTPMPVRRPMYALSLVALAVPAWDRTGDLMAVIASLVNPFCVVVLCMELDRFTYSRNRELYGETQRAEAERIRADKVLYNVLPASIADELKRDDKVNAVKFENMGVMFADIVGFTAFSRGLPPDALVMVLGQIFSSFDDLVERHGLEKIKTIGDAYMVVSYQRIPSLCQLALDMSAAVERYNSANGTQLSLRIGIHAGPAVAGVIGVKRFLYDVWGDTVNVASRIEASGKPGAIHVSEAVCLQAREAFGFKAREPIELRGRGPMATYWLLGSSAAGIS
ncbi:MAG: adenylate/guanylate cyclase domain-containing protein [Burkholderiales bacterium]|nr:adenylate/guanylate cyclase domain-containing protein [Burkholderiales bacterium]